MTIKITRREALKTTGMALAGTMLGSMLPKNGFSATKKPNIVFILSDDHRWNHLGVKGHPWVQTPNLDRMASEGVLFNNAFCTTSLCSPSRASFITGQYAHHHGVKNNLKVWDNKNETVLEHLKKVGYRTGFVGKWHMPGPLPKLRGVDRFITFQARTGQGLYFNCPLFIDGVETKREGTYITKDLTDYALDFIRQEKDNPFCLYLAHKAPHGPFINPPDVDENLYKDESIDHLPKWAHRFSGMANGEIYGMGLGSVEAKHKKYNRLITSVDQQVGRVMDELDRLGIADNTILVYTTDNGLLVGENGHYDKRWAYDQALRLPFIVRYPDGIKNPGRQTDEMVLNIDVAPFLLDMAGAPIPEHMDGLSFRTVLQDRPTNLRDSFLYEFYKDFPPYTVPDIDAVRTRQYLYVEYNQSRMAPELFDVRKITKDPVSILETPKGQQVLPELKQLLEQYKREKNHG
jgi:arylsulfatase A-like enzyme